MPATLLRSVAKPSFAYNNLMTLTRLILRNLFFHRRGNFAVLLGVAVGAAVITGALLVGDSLRGSLRDRALRRIGWVEEALVAPRFFRQPMAALRNGSVPWGITLNATIEAADGSKRIGGGTVWAIHGNLGMTDLTSAGQQPSPWQQFVNYLPFFTTSQRTFSPGFVAPFPLGIRPEEGYI